MAGRSGEAGRLGAGGRMLGVADVAEAVVVIADVGYPNSRAASPHFGEAISFTGFRQENDMDYVQQHCSWGRGGAV